MAQQLWKMFQILLLRSVLHFDIQSRLERNYKKVAHLSLAYLLCNKWKSDEKQTNKQTNK